MSVPRAARRRRPVPATVRRRVLAAVALAVATVPGCGLTAEKAARVEYVVVFEPDATAQRSEAVRSACPGVGAAVLLPPARNDLRTSTTYPVRYDVTLASARDRSRLLACLNQQPGLRGVSEARQGE